jgi:hypothetical protein
MNIDTTKKYMVRSNGSGVWAGTIKELDGDTAVMTNARRVWYWEGAASLSELAQRGTSNPDGCKFPVPVEKVIVFNVLEIIMMTSDAWENIENVPIWTC